MKYVNIEDLRCRSTILGYLSSIPMKIFSINSIICSLLLVIVATIVQAQPGTNSTIIFEEEWESAVKNTIPTGWTGDIDEANLLDTAWVVANGPTSTGNTGPNAANSGSQYIYFKSGSPAGTNAMSDLVSPSITISGTNPTLSFALFMYGSDIGMLDVSITHSGGTSTLQTYSTQIQTAKSDLWSIQTIDLSAYSGQSVQIMFRAQKMTVGLGDIGIDSISVYSLTASQPIPTLGQWGLILLSLMILILTVTQVSANMAKSQNGL